MFAWPQLGLTHKVLKLVSAALLWAWAPLSSGSSLRLFLTHLYAFFAFFGAQDDRMPLKAIQ